MPLRKIFIENALSFVVDEINHDQKTIFVVVVASIIISLQFQFFLNPVIYDEKKNMV
jgi:hypothetical protein